MYSHRIIAHWDRSARGNKVVAGHGEKPAEFLVNVYSLVNATPDASLTVTTPIVTPTSALAETVNLSMLIAMNLLRA